MAHAGTTGDILARASDVAHKLTAIGYPKRVRMAALRDGDLATLLPILHFVLLNYSPHILDAGSREALASTDDATFVDRVFRHCINGLGFNPGLNPRQFLSPGFSERKLLFAAALIDTVQAAHEEAERAGGPNRRRTTLPYRAAVVGHYSDPVGASTRSFLSVAQRVEPEPRANELLPPQARVLPSDSSRTRPASGVIYSGGAQSSTEGVGAPQHVQRFLSDAVALGEGAHASVSARRKATLSVASTSGGVQATLAAAINPGLLSASGWRERVDSEVAAMRASHASSGVSAAPPPPPHAPPAPPHHPAAAASPSSPFSRLPVHKERLPGGVLSRSPDRAGGGPGGGGAPAADPLPLPTVWGREGGGAEMRQRLGGATAPSDEEEPTSQDVPVPESGGGERSRSALAALASSALASSLKLEAQLEERVRAAEERVAALREAEREERGARAGRAVPAVAVVPPPVHAATAPPSPPGPSPFPVPQHLYSYLPLGSRRDVQEEEEEQEEEGGGGDDCGRDQTDFDSARQRLLERRRERAEVQAYGHAGGPQHRGARAPHGYTGGAGGGSGVHGGLADFLATMAAGAAETEAVLARAQGAARVR